GKIRPKQTCDEPTVHVDLFPTFLELARGKAPKQALDGMSVLPLWLNPGEVKLKREAIYLHFPGYLEAGQKGWRTTPAGMIRAGDYTLLEFFEDGKLELYNVANDIGQKNDLSKTMPEKTKELHGMLVKWRKDIGAPMPTLKKGSLGTAPGAGAHAVSAWPSPGLTCQE